MTKLAREWRPTEVAKDVHTALKVLGGRASTADITKRSKLLGNPNGTSVALRPLAERGYVRCLGGRGAGKVWELLKDLPK